LALHTRESLQPEQEQCFISIPALFNLYGEKIKYRIVLKNAENSPAVISNTTILLTCEIECEYEIPDELIYPVPRILNFTRLHAHISGLFFNEEKTILILNPDILKNIKQKDNTL
jgi:hypothetical protein